MSPPNAADAATKRMEAYARDRGLMYFDNWTLPQATQLLKHGFMQEVRNLCQGDLPGDIEKGWLAHFAYRTLDDVERSRFFTVAIAPARESVQHAVRVFCHDRGLSELDTSNPEEGLELVELPDRRLKFESEALLRRYTLWSDHDQDELKAWQMFDPSLIAWLTDEAPEGFSFEVQNGAISCFVPGVIDDNAALDGLCAATARVRKHVVTLADGVAGAAALPAAAASRDAIADDRIARKPFEQPPSSVRAAARHLGRWPLFISDASWQLGAEAFFRLHAARHGLKRIDPEVYMAAHIDSVIPGEVTQVAEGTLPGSDLRGELLWSTEVDNRGLGWQTVRAELQPDDNGFAFSLLPEFEQARKEDGYETTSDATALIIFKASEPHGRDAEKLDEFLSTAVPLLAKAVAEAKKRPG